jgi:S-disulfanyl-L-cysteine oxidoreductase SoxD
MRCTPISTSKSSFLLPAVLLLACGASWAQGPTYKLGRTPTEAEVKAWDHAVGPEGKELPAGSGSAVEGAKVFAAKCSFCHGKNAEGIFPWPRLAGGVGTLNTPTPIRSSGSYLPYATTIWDFINRAMPRDAEGTLSPGEVYAVTAFILFKNGIIKETDVLDKKSLVEVKMPNRDGFFPTTPQAKPDKDHSWLPFWDQVKELRKEDKAFDGK